MKTMLLAAVVLGLAACGGTETKSERMNRWVLSVSDGRTANLDIQFSDDAPTQVVTGTLMLAGTVVSTGGYADADFGHLLATIDAFRWINLDVAFGTQSISGEWCEHTRTSQAPQSSDAQCATFIGLPR